MARSRKDDSYEMVLESRHLLALFFAVVLLCALFFTFGFVLGRNQEPAPSAASPPAQEPPPSAEGAAPTAKDLSFYKRVEGRPPSGPLPRRKRSSAAVSSPQKRPTPTSSPSRTAEPIYLQVAALSHNSDAKRLASELEKLGFPVVVRQPKKDRLYRVQVGPFANAELAAAAQRRLEGQGFRQIIRR